jgi:ribonuclease Z
MMPMPYRLLSSMAVRLDGRLYLFDAGEGTQINWKKLRLGVRGLRLIAVTHLHADHCLGIPGMLMLRAQMDDPGPLTILGPPGTRDFITQCQRTLEFYTNYPIDFVEWGEGRPQTAFQDESVRILWSPLQHTRFCLGYRLEELERPGKFDPAIARSLDVPEGPLWGKLQRGEPVPSRTGERIDPGQVLGPPRRGRHIAYVVDTRPTPGISLLCRNADLAFIEGMFLSQHSQHAEEKGHLTVSEAAGLAHGSGAHRAVLIHISPRYDTGDIPLLETEAARIFSDATVGRDLQVYPVKYPEMG